MVCENVSPFCSTQSAFFILTKEVLLTHHTRGEHSKQKCFNDKAQDNQELLWFVQASCLVSRGLLGGHQTVLCVHSMVTVMSTMVGVNAIGKAKNDQGHGIGTRQECVEDKEQKVLVIANADTVVDPMIVVAMK